MRVQPGSNGLRLPIGATFNQSLNQTEAGLQENHQILKAGEEAYNLVKESLLSVVERDVRVCGCVCGWRVGGRGCSLESGTV